MLDSMTPGQFMEWCAKDIIEPIGTDIAVCEILTKLGMIIAAFVGTKTNRETFMPWTKHPEESKQLTPKQSMAAIGHALRMAAPRG